MATSEKAINFIQGSLETGKAIPGQSLTNDPQQPYNWEQSSEYNNPNEAMLYIFESLTVPETTANTLLSVSNGVAIIDIASIVLYSGFLEGKWNPDLMTLLMEPTMYMLMALSEKAEIDYVLDAGDDKQNTVEMSGNKAVKVLQDGVNELDKIKQQAVKKVNPQSVPQEVREIIEQTELSPSLLERIEQKKPTSLLSRGE